MCLVKVEVGAGFVQLAKRDERLERVSPYGDCRLVHPAGKQPAGQVAQAAGGRLHVAEQKLETAKHAEPRDRVELDRVGPGELEAFLDRRACGLYQAQIRLDQPSDASDPGACMPVLGL